MFRNSVYFTVYTNYHQKKGSSVQMDEFSLTNLSIKLKIERVTHTVIHVHFERSPEVISVIIPAYNRENTIAASINSILNQTYKDIEVIVVDDGSTDGTAAAVQSIKDSRVIYHFQENAGACVARNTGVRLAKGEYIAFQDSDDYWHSDKLEKQLAILQEHSPDVVFCKLCRIMPDGTRSVMTKSIPEGFLAPNANLFGIGTQAIIGRREVFEAHQFDPDMPRFQDYELLYRIAKECSIYCLDEALVDYEIGADSISSNSRRLIQACRLLIEKHPDLCKNQVNASKTFARMLWNTWLYNRKDADFDAKACIRTALTYNHSIKYIAKTILVYLGLYELYRKLDSRD